MGRMSDAEREQYDVQGYIVVRGLFGRADLEPWRERFDALVSGRVPPARGLLVMRDVMIAKAALRAETREAEIQKLQFLEHDPVFFSFTTHPRLLDWAEDFVGPDIKTIHTMLINKPPVVDGRHPLHQDMYYFPFRPFDRVVAAQTALEACTRENGCLAVVPGSHKVGRVVDHELPDWEWVNHGYLGVKDTACLADRVHLEMEPGDTVFFHPLLFHGSGHNRTRGFRKVISTHFASAHCRYLAGIDRETRRRDGRVPYTLVRGSEQPQGI